MSRSRRRIKLFSRRETRAKLTTTSGCIPQILPNLHVFMFVQVACRHVTCLFMSNLQACRMCRCTIHPLTHIPADEGRGTPQKALNSCVTIHIQASISGETSDSSIYPPNGTKQSIVTLPLRQYAEHSPCISLCIEQRLLMFSAEPSRLYCRFGGSRVAVRGPGSTGNELQP